MVQCGPAGKLYNVIVPVISYPIQTNICINIFYTYRIYSNSSIDYIFPSAIINFSLVWVWVLIEDGSYSRAAFINFGPIPHSVLHKIVAQKTGL